MTGRLPAEILEYFTQRNTVKVIQKQVDKKPRHMVVMEREPAWTNMINHYSVNAYEVDKRNNIEKEVTIGDFYILDKDEFATCAIGVMVHVLYHTLAESDKVTDVFSYIDKESPYKTKYITSRFRDSFFTLVLDIRIDLWRMRMSLKEGQVGNFDLTNYDLEVELSGDEDTIMALIGWDVFSYLNYYYPDQTTDFIKIDPDELKEKMKMINKIRID